MPGNLAIFAAAGSMLLLLSVCGITIPTGEATPTPTPFHTPPPTQTPYQTPTPFATQTPAPTPAPTAVITRTPAPTPTPAPPTPTPVIQPARVPLQNGNFETGDYSHWTVNDEGFGNEPSDIITANVNHMYLDRPYLNYEGRYAASSYLPIRDAGARGTLTSEEFTVSKPYLEFLVTGMQNAQIYVELWVDGRAVKHLEPDNPTTTFRRVSWDVSQWVNKRGYLKIVDASSTRPHGYIEVDDFYLIDTPTVSPS